MGLSFSGEADSVPAGLQWTFTPSTSVAALSIVASPALSAAGKSIQWAGRGSVLTCIVYGLNEATIPTGPLAVVHATMAANAVSGTVGFANTQGASAAGDPMAVAATGGAVAIVLPVVKALNCTASGLASGATASCTGDGQFSGSFRRHRAAQLGFGEPQRSCYGAGCCRHCERDVHG
jgi:hypothetical protein